MADASAATAINSTLTGMMQISVRSILKKALVNAIIATELSIIDSTLGGASLTQVRNNAVLAFATGFVASVGVLKLMTFFRTVKTLEIFLCVAGTSSIGFGAFGAIDSAENGNYLQAAYRFALGVFGAVESAKGIRDIEAAIKASKPKVETPEPSGKGGIKTVDVKLSKKKYPESAQHIEEAIKEGQPDILTIDRGGASARRKASLKGVDTVPGLDRDEYPPAMSMEGGSGASVKLINPSDNRGSGSSISGQLRKYPNGTKYRIIITDED